jgi:hypothetical protein
MSVEQAGTESSEPVGPETETFVESETPLTPEQRELLTTSVTTPRIIRNALSFAVLSPLRWALLWFLGGFEDLSPLSLVWLVIAALCLVPLLAFPFVFVARIGWLVNKKRPLVVEDAEGGKAEVLTGRFGIEDAFIVGKKLKADKAGFRLSRKEMKRLRPALHKSEKKRYEIQKVTFNGSVAYAPRSKTVLLVSDADGATLVEAH